MPLRHILYTNIKAYCTINIHTFYQNTCTPWQLLQSLPAILQGKACPLHCLVVFACQWLFYGHARNKPCVARGEEVDCLLRRVFVVPRTTETGKRKQRGREQKAKESGSVRKCKRKQWLEQLKNIFYILYIFLIKVIWSADGAREMNSVRSTAWLYVVYEILIKNKCTVTLNWPFL